MWSPASCIWVQFYTPFFSVLLCRQHYVLLNLLGYISNITQNISVYEYMDRSGQLRLFLTTTKWVCFLIGKNFRYLTVVRQLLLCAPSMYLCLTSFLCFKTGNFNERTLTLFLMNSQNQHNILDILKVSRYKFETWKQSYRMCLYLPCVFIHFY
jgi:hypothetical protein